MSEKIIDLTESRKDRAWRIFKNKLLKKDGMVAIFRHPPIAKKAVSKDRFKDLVNLKTDVSSEIFQRQLGELKAADFVSNLRMEEGIFQGIDTDGSYFFMGKSLSSMNGNRLICFFWFKEEDLKKAITDKNDEVIVKFVEDFSNGDDWLEE